MQKYISLNDGNKIPAVGFGLFMIPADGSTSTIKLSFAKK